MMAWLRHRIGLDRALPPPVDVWADCPTPAERRFERAKPPAKVTMERARVANERARRIASFESLFRDEETDR
jgi:hypothetical protein